MEITRNYEDYLMALRAPPPIGPQPEHIWREHRVKHLLEAMSREGHKWANMLTWVDELTGHIEWLERRERAY